MTDKELPKVLVVSRVVWDDTQGTASTLSNFFQYYDPFRIAHIYIETKTPYTKYCNLFFQISEFSLIRKILWWKSKTGFRIDMGSGDVNQPDNQIANKEENTMNFVRKHRSIFFTVLRELLWLLGGWRTNELKSFIDDFNPDVIFLDSSPLVFMNRISAYVLNISKKPGVILLMDDNYTYQSVKGNIPNSIYRFFLRNSIKPLIDKCEKVFVYSPKMKREYDAIFKTNSILFTKGLDISKINYNTYEVHDPIKLVYLGQVIYGRIYTLIAIAEALKKINSPRKKIQLHIYTNNTISESLKKKLIANDCVFIMDPVPYTEVPRIISESDVLLFVESFEQKYKNTARLSFSTKITDYLGSGKCILAIGPDDIAPIEYFTEEEAALIVTDLNELHSKLEYLCNQSIIKEYSQKAFDCAFRNHDIREKDSLLKSTLINIADSSII